MEFWTSTREQFGWRQWPDVVQGLLGFCESSHGSVLLVSDRPDEEIESLLATVGLVRQLAGKDVSIVVASPHPSEEWLGPLKECGIDHVWVIDRSTRPKADRLDGPGKLEAPRAICPALHVRTGERLTLSVCGRHGDRMVLARHHLERWCLGRNEDCPHWRGDDR